MSFYCASNFSRGNITDESSSSCSSPVVIGDSDNQWYPAEMPVLLTFLVLPLEMYVATGHLKKKLYCSVLHLMLKLN